MVNSTETILIQTQEDLVKARQQVRAWTIQLGFGLVDQTKIVTASSELLRNMLLAAKGGTLLLEILETSLRIGLRLTFEDQGPGIENIEVAMRDGYTSWGGMGLGLSGSKRLMDEFEISSEVGVGTWIRVTKWK